MTIAASTVEKLIERLDLQPHPEGGFYRQTYCCDEEVTRADHTPRRAATGIYYLLHGQNYSAWHRLDSDEMWHFYAGDSLLIHMLDEHGQYQAQRLGNMSHGPNAAFQWMVPAGCWFAAEREGTLGYALVGCSVAPGFAWEGFELADAQALLDRYPQHGTVIRRLARTATATSSLS